MGRSTTARHATSPDAQGITPRAGGGRIAWIQDSDGNTFAIEADD